MNQHFVEMLRELSSENAEFLVIGAHAVAAHGYSRGTRDLDIWVRPTPDNARRVWRALVSFGAPMHDLSVEHLSNEDVIYQVGIDPARIDIITSPTGLDFESAWPNRVMVTVAGHSYPFLGREDLIRAKRATGRRQDLLDLDNLERQ